MTKMCCWRNEMHLESGILEGTIKGGYLFKFTYLAHPCLVVHIAFVATRIIWLFMYRYEMPWTCCGCIMLRHAASMSIIVYHVYLPESLRNLHCSCHWATGPLGVMFRGFASFRCAPGLLGLRRLGHLDGLLPPVLVWIPAKIW